MRLQLSPLDGLPVLLRCFLPGERALPKLHVSSVWRIESGSSALVILQRRQQPGRLQPVPQSSGRAGGDGRQGRDGRRANHINQRRILPSFLRIFVN